MKISLQEIAISWTRQSISINLTLLWKILFLALLISNLQTFTEQPFTLQSRVAGVCCQANLFNVLGSMSLSGRQRSPLCTQWAWECHSHHQWLGLTQRNSSWSSIRRKTSTIYWACSEYPSAASCEGWLTRLSLNITLTFVLLDLFLLIIVETQRVLPKWVVTLCFS